MTMPDKQPYKPYINRAWPTRHWPIIVALGMSLSLHGVLLLDSPSVAPLSNKTVINAKLLRKQPEGNAAKEEKPQTEQSVQQPAIKTTQKPAHKAAKPHIESTSKANKMTKTPISTPAENKTVAEQPIQPIVPDTALKSSSEKHKNHLKEHQADSAIAPVKQQHQNQQHVVLQKKGQEEKYSDPVERSYAQQILTHLDQHLIAPQHLRGQVRLSLTIRYGQIATQVEVIKSSGSAEVDDWVLKAVLAANPFPVAPAQLPSPYIFRPTIDLSR